MCSRGLLFAVLLAGVILLADPNPRAQQAQSDQPPVFRSGVQVVQVEVGVTDKQGQPVRGLGPADFAVTVGGQPRRVLSAEFIDIEKAHAALGTRADVVPVSTNEGAGVGRLFAFVVDSNTLETGDARQVADAAAPFFSRLTFADRSALVSLPVGPGVPFTWAHHRVRDAMRRVAATRGAPAGWEYGSLTDARDIATRGPSAVRLMGMRGCSSSTLASGGGFGQPRPGSTTGGSEQTPSSGGSSSRGTGETQPAPTGGSGNPSGGLSADRCLREIQSEAQMVWRMARLNSLSSVAALQQFLAALARVPGDKTVVLISGGWPLDEGEQHSLLTTVAADAAAARATLFTVFMPQTASSVTRRYMSSTPVSDESLHSWPLETLAGMTGGRSFKANAAADWVFERLARELGGYYRIGVERSASDGDRNRRMKVQVGRSGGITVRAREIFDVKTYEDRDWPARLASAVESPVPATALSLRLTSYVAADAEDPAYLRLVLVGDASRLQPGEATMQLLLRDLDGKRIGAGDQRLGDVQGSAIPFAANVRVSPGSYMVRIAVMDGAGRVGSVDHRVEARPVMLDRFAVTGPRLVQVPPAGQADPRFTVDGVRQDSRLALEVDLRGDTDRLANADVVFEIAATADGPALIEQPASLSRGGPRGDALIAQAVADVRLLPPGQYLARAKVRTGEEPLGEVRRAFAVLEDPVLTDAEAPAATTGVTPRAWSPGAAIRGRAAAAIPAFTVDDVLSRPILDAFLDRVAARPDAAWPGGGDLLDQARAADVAHLEVSDAQAAQAPIAAFLKGLKLLAQKKIDPAALAFRSAMRASPDFYPAMVYLGACYAAAGKDKEAAAIWRTALIKEGGAPLLHVLLSDALLRQGSGDLAVQVVSAARARWPEDDGLKRRFAIAALLAGNYAAGLQAVDDLLERAAADARSLVLALLVLYDSLTNQRTIDSMEQDRARMVRLAEAYRAHGGPSIALVDTWVAAVSGREAPKPK